MINPNERDTLNKIINQIGPIAESIANSERHDIIDRTHKARAYILKAQDEVMAILRETSNPVIKDVALTIYDSGKDYQNRLAMLGGSLLVTLSPTLAVKIIKKGGKM